MATTLVLFLFVLSIFSCAQAENYKPTINGQGPNCPICSAQVALPCGVTLSEQIVKTAKGVLASAKQEPWTQLSAKSKKDKNLGGPSLWVIEAKTTKIMVWPFASSTVGKLLVDLIKDGVDSPSGEIAKMDDTAPGWFNHSWGALTDYKTKATFVDTANFNGKKYYLAAGYFDQWADWAKANAAATDECLDTYSTWCAQAKVFRLVGKIITDVNTAPNPTAQSTILNDVTYSTKYRDFGFYVFVCSYDPANKEVATITQHGFVKAIIGKQLHVLKYHMDFGERYNKELGHKLARDEIRAAEAGGGWVDYLWYRKHTHQETTSKKFAYIMPYTAKTNVKSKLRYYLGVGFDDRCGSANSLTVEAKCPNNIPTNSDRAYLTKVCSKCVGACLCGNGQRGPNEACDDGNQKPGDGCNGDCTKVETGFACLGGSRTSKDTCDVSQAPEKSPVSDDSAVEGILVAVSLTVLTIILGDFGF